MARKKKKPNSFQPWPAEAWEPYQKAISLHKLLAEDIAKSINRGTRAIPRNKFVVEALIDFIIQGCTELDQACQEIKELYIEDSVGRPPKWLTLTKEIQERVREISRLAHRVKPALRVNKLPYLVDVYDGMEEESNGILDLFETHPYRARSVSLEIWEEAITKAVKRLES